MAPVARSNLSIRLSTAAVVVPLLLLLMFRGPAWGFFLLVMVASGVAAQELFRMTHPLDRLAQWIGVATSMALSTGLYCFAHEGRKLFALLIGVILLGLMVPLWRLGDIQTAALRVMAGVAGPIYSGGLLTTLALLRRDAGELGPGYVLMTLTFAWLGDTGGYFGGRFLGKTKLYEAISPKKTRAGFVGAVVGAIAGGLLAHFVYLPEVSLEWALALGFVSGVVGQLGDLVESLIKRSIGVKDSGSIVPGHGGMLDRVDALLVVAPLVYLYVLWVRLG